MYVLAVSLTIFVKLIEVRCLVDGSSQLSPVSMPRWCIMFSDYWPCKVRKKIRIQSRLLQDSWCFYRDWRICMHLKQLKLYCTCFKGYWLVVVLVLSSWTLPGVGLRWRTACLIWSILDFELGLSDFLPWG